MKKIKINKNYYIGLFAVWIALITLPFSWNAIAQKKLQSSSTEQIVVNFVNVIMQNYHYEKKPLTDEISKQLFDEYFDQLDHNHCFFMAQDIEEFKKYRTQLDDMLKENNIDFAYKVYEKFRQRVAERTQYVNIYLKNKVDFTTNEEILLDRAKEPWFTNKKQYNQYWNKRIKNSLLTYEMMDAAEKNKPKKDDKTKIKPAPTKTPAERVQKFYERYKKQIAENESLDVAEIYLTTYTKIYDPHSTYMAPDTEEDFDISMRLSLSGIGAVLTVDGPFIKITEIMPGGPSDLDGRLKSGDRIIAVAQEGGESIDIIDMPLRKAVKLIRGQKGSKVYLTILQSGKSLGSVPVIYDITRDKIKLTEQEAKSKIYPINLKNNKTTNILHIDLPSFYVDFEGMQKRLPNYKSTTNDIKKLIAKSQDKNIGGMILDLRTNGGGSLEEAIKLAGLFFPEGPVVQVRSANGVIDKRVDPDKNTVFDKPLIVLVNRFSASASEIVAACLQDYHRAIIVGDSMTHGKGTVQTIIHIDDQLRNQPIFKNKKHGSIKFTMAKFYRINGGSTQVKGVVPDITFPSYTDYMKLGEARLPHVMPWDEIPPLKYSCPITVQKYLPTIKSNIAKSLKNDKKYQQYLKNVAKYGEYSKRKTITLNKQKRMALIKEEEEWAEKIKQSLIGDKKKMDDKKNKDENYDFMLQESLKIMSQLIDLNNTK